MARLVSMVVMVLFMMSSPAVLCSGDGAISLPAVRGNFHGYVMRILSDNGKGREV